MKKTIMYLDRQCVLACDGRCDKAWGINGRPRLFYMEPDAPPRALRDDEEPQNEDDYIFVGDDALGIAPADTGVYEGGDGKPSATPITDPSLMNKWCARECERSDMFEPDGVVRLPNLKRPMPNVYARSGCPRHPGGNRECGDLRCLWTWVPEGAPTPEEQLRRWVAGESVCPNTSHECCPDFSCCRPSLKWPQDKREAFMHAGQGEREKMMMGALGALAGAAGEDVYVTRGDPDDHG